MSGHSPEDTLDRIEDEASAWVVRLGEGALSPEQAREFAAWCAADPEHDRRFRALQRTWSEIPALTHLAALALPIPDNVAAAEPPPSTPRRRWMVGGGVAAAVAAAAAALAVLVPTGRPGSGRYATDLAQSRRITLADGSIVTLGARSAIAVQFARHERRIVLSRGEAFFEVVHDPDRPFLVEAGSSLVRDIGTRFDVKLGDGAMHVSVQEGQVQISGIAGTAPSDEGTAMLRAGQRAEIVAAMPSASTSAPSDHARIVALPSPAAGAWREGRLVYDNGRLADLVADVNRYYAPGVRLATPDTGELRITASFRTNEIPAFMNALSATLPVRAEAGSNGAFEISTARR
ncbi:FecR domain-containing protein [Sphingomonas cannabina]|uniref:FecR family protein n=1 Tax=Sphingomonas cannabina TaxID=2899123 RepID=UPI001F31AEDD|nr:FecR domain-containing protein [Sphingomonas cannabina]UIJ46287.1 FecR domain-containing protein [Sphingomonas cannabina]